MGTCAETSRRAGTGREPPIAVTRTRASLGLFTLASESDRIVVLEQGRIVAQGRHDDLLQSSPLYAQLAVLQFGEPLRQTVQRGAVHDQLDSA